MIEYGWLELLERSAPARLARESEWLYPGLLSFHLLGVGALFGAALVIDICWWRRAGDAMGGLAPDPAARVAGAGFGVAALSGAWLFAAHATSLAGQAVFQLKVALIGVAATNAWFARRSLRRKADVSQWRVRAEAVVSALGWGLAIILGRWIGFSG
jgi:hypothetical protein